MIDLDELRRDMKLIGYDKETIDEILARYYGYPVALDALAVMLDQLKLELTEAAQSMVEVWEQLAAAGVGQPLQKKEKPRRPPRCIGPKNKAATRAQRPARVARSSCRKVRR